MPERGAPASSAGTSAAAAGPASPARARVVPTGRLRGAALAAFAAGLVHAAGFEPLDHWTVPLAALAALFALVAAATARDRGVRAPWLLAGAFSIAWFGAGLSWLFVSMHTYGGMPAPMAALAVVLFAAYLSIYPVAATAIAWRLAGDAGPLALAATLAGAWTLAELARGWVFTGFPWLAVGYGQIDGPLARLAPLGGVHAVGLVAVAVAALAGFALAAALARRAEDRAAHDGAAARRPLVPALVALALVLAPAAVPAPSAWTEPFGEPLSVRLVQGNVAQDMKFQPERTVAAMADYATRFEAGTAALTLLPETAWTVPWDRTPEPIARRILDHAARGHAIAIGMPLWTEPRTPGEEPRIANSVLLVTPGHASGAADGPAPRYDKRHLVPFGEFVPWGFGWFVRMMRIPLGDFARGAPGQAPFEVGGQRVMLNVCYEDLFGEEIREALPGARGATILANVTNIGWFGRSHALAQHLAIARMRSLETGRPMLRATNTGTTAAIDADGRVTAALEPFVTGSLDVVVQGTTGLTPFARRGTAPLLVAAIGATALGALAAAAARRGRARRQTR